MYSGYDIRDGRGRRLGGGVCYYENEGGGKGKSENGLIKYLVSQLFRKARAEEGGGVGRRGQHYRRFIKKR